MAALLQWAEGRGCCCSSCQCSRNWINQATSSAADYTCFTASSNQQRLLFGRPWFPPPLQIKPWLLACLLSLLPVFHFLSSHLLESRLIRRDCWLASSRSSIFLNVAHPSLLSILSHCPPLLNPTTVKLRGPLPIRTPSYMQPSSSLLGDIFFIVWPHNLWLTSRVKVWHSTLESHMMWVMKDGLWTKILAPIRP